MVLRIRLKLAIAAIVVAGAIAGAWVYTKRAHVSSSEANAYVSGAVCAGCHARFDGFGLAFEGYGPVGESRRKDLAGRAIDAGTSFPGGSQGAGLEGVRSYIREHRQAQFLEGFSRKLLVFALNRSLQLSDEPLVDRMTANLAARDFRFSALVETIVNSPQFLNRRGPGSHEIADSLTKKAEIER